MLKANDIKVEFIKWLLDNESDIVLGNEVLFSTNQRRADLLMIKNNCTYAFEIKSESDKIQKLKEQLDDYCSTFDYTIILIPPKYLKQLSTSINNRIGLYVIDADGIKKIQSPKKQPLKNIETINLLEFLDKRYLLKLLNQKGLSKHSVYDLRIMALNNLSKKNIKQASTDFLNERYNKLFELFKLDTKCSFVSKDDLRSLTGNIKTDRIF